jgi:hypothetical protein
MRALIPHANTFGDQAGQLVRWAVDLTMRDEVFTNAICCLSASHMRSIANSDILYPTLSQSVLQFKHQTIVGLNRRLARPISKLADLTPYLVVALMATEVCTPSLNTFVSRLISGTRLWLEMPPNFCFTPKP